MVSKKIIGIPAYKSYKLDSFGAGLSHLEFLSTFGDVVLIMNHEGFRQVDLLYLPGGADIDPANYGEAPGFHTTNPDVHKEYFYKNNLDKYIEANVPIFGVCLGCQTLGVKFGCKLKQHLTWHPQSKNRYEPAHNVLDLRMGEEFAVNSHHHQAIMDYTFNEELLERLAVYQDDNEGLIIEAFKHRSLPIYGVQWHPEEWYDPFSMKIIKSLLKIEE